MSIYRGVLLWKTRLHTLCCGSINYMEDKKFWSGGFLYNPNNKKVFLHLRDSNTKYNPNMYAFFGGLNEGVETPVQCFVRELNEEAGLLVDAKQVIPLTDYYNSEFKTYRYVFYVVSNVIKSDLTLGEGAGFEWVCLQKLNQLKCTEKTLKDLQTFTSKLNI